VAQVLESLPSKEELTIKKNSSTSQIRLWEFIYTPLEASNLRRWFHRINLILTFPLLKTFPLLQNKFQARHPWLVPVIGWDQEDQGLRLAQAKRSQDTHLQNNQSKMNWRCGSSGRVPTLQVW
jgi:hypothetical protein